MGGDHANPRGSESRAPESNEDAVDRHVGGRLAALRTAQGLSESDFARRIGITGPTLRRYETGAAPMGASILFRSAKLLGVAVEHFYDGLSDGSSVSAGMIPPPAESPVIRRELVELAKNFSRIPDAESRKRVLSLVRSLAER